MIAFALFGAWCLLTLWEYDSGKVVVDPQKLSGVFGSYWLAILAAVLVSWGMVNLTRIVPGSFTRAKILRILRRAAYFAVFLLILVAEEDIRGWLSWVRCQHRLKSRGEQLAFAYFTPKPVPDKKNFALIPLFTNALNFDRYVPGDDFGSISESSSLTKLDSLSAELNNGSTNSVILGNLSRRTFADLGAWARFYRENTNYPQASAESEPAKVILTAVETFAPDIRELAKEASERPFCRFPIVYDHQPSYQILLPHLAHLKRIVILLHVHSVAALEAGRPNDAAKDVELGLRLASAPDDEPFLISQLVVIASLQINLQAIQEGLVRHAWTTDQLMAFETTLASIDFLARHQFAMRAERACWVSLIDFLRKKGPFARRKYLLGDQGTSALEAYNFMPGGWFYQNMRVFSDNIQEFCLPAVDERQHLVVLPRYLSGYRMTTNPPVGPVSLFSRLLFEAENESLFRFATAQTCVDQASLACALERYRLAKGSFPQQVDDLVPGFIAEIPRDVMDGKPLRYRRTKDGKPILYSIGWNGRDDGGEIATRQEFNMPRLDTRQGDWVWEMRD
jgi:hypothetical protein